jgi:hypothetical protein
MVIAPASVAGQDIAIPHMPQLVGQHSFKLFIVEKIEDALGYGDGCMFGVAPGGKGIRGITGDDIDSGHGERHAGQYALHDLVHAGQLLAGDRLRLVHGQRQLVGIEVAEEIHPGGNKESQDHSIAAAKMSAEENEKEGESSQ